MLKEPTPQTGSADILATITKMVKAIQKNHDVKAVGVSTAGMVNDRGEMVGGCGNIQGWKDTKVQKDLEALTGLPVVVENDANCAAFAEYTVGSAENYNPVLLVIVGTGIGGGLVWDNRIWRGAHFGGGEIGHIKLSANKHRRCTCGGWDCWEAYASGTGLQNTARLYFTDPDFDNYKLMNEYHKGNPIALDVINRWHEYLAQGMSSVINSLDPEAVVVSGGMAQFINYADLDKKVRAKVVDGLKDHIKIIEGTLGNDSGMIGGACLANLMHSGQLAQSVSSGHDTPARV
jgi:glucokinase